MIIVERMVVVTMTPFGCVDTITVVNIDVEVVEGVGDLCGWVLVTMVGLPWAVTSEVWGVVGGVVSVVVGGWGVEDGVGGVEDTGGGLLLCTGLEDGDGGVEEGGTGVELGVITGVEEGVDEGSVVGPGSEVVGGALTPDCRLINSMRVMD